MSCVFTPTVLILFFCTDTATTYIYTYVHTFSRHDALPIWAERFWPAVMATQRLGYRGLATCWSLEEEAPDPASPALAGLPDAKGEATIEARSEEHTSELQSLMRSSYAVFCLKNNNKRHT